MLAGQLPEGSVGLVRFSCTLLLSLDSLLKTLSISLPTTVAGGLIDATLLI